REAAYEEALGRRALQSISVERGAIDEVRELLRVLATTPSLQAIETGDCQRWLGDVAARYPYVASLVVSDNDRRVLCSVPGAQVGYQSPETPLRQRAQVR